MLNDEGPLRALACLIDEQQGRIWLLPSGGKLTVVPLEVGDGNSN